MSKTKLHFRMYGYTDLEAMYGVSRVASWQHRSGRPIRTRLDNVKALLSASSFRAARAFAAAVPSDARASYLLWSGDVATGE